MTFLVYITSVLCHQCFYSKLLDGVTLMARTQSMHKPKSMFSLSPRLSYLCSLSSVQFSHSVVSNSLWSHELQHARPPCPSPTPGVHPNPCPLCRWCHPTISSSVVPFFSCVQSFPASGSFQMSQLSALGGQSWSFSFNISSSNEYPGLPRQHIKKQKHYFVNKGPSSQSYGFSSSQVWMWELDYK